MGLDVILPNSGMVGGPSEMVRRFLIQGSRLTEIPPRKPLKVDPDRKVRVLAVVHGWFPILAAGSERMMQHMLDVLPRDEFEVEVWHFGIGEPDATSEGSYLHEGTPVTRGFDPPTGFVPDVIITHHGYAARVVPSLYEEWPHVTVVGVYHNERYDIPDIDRIGADLRVYNTRWVRDRLRGSGPIVHPPLEYDRHKVDSIGDAVTLVNLQDNKGVHTFTRVAARMDGFRFLGVDGTHGEQVHPDLPNVDFHPVTQDMREVWSQTKVVLMPSEYESYGMVAAEACVNGIPVIAHPTKGLVECLDSAGLFIPRDDIDGYERTLRLLLTDPLFYAERSAISRLRGEELARQTDRELRRFVRRLRKLVRA
jgi:hypothetical protein